MGFLKSIKEMTLTLIGDCKFLEPFCESAKKREQERKQKQADAETAEYRKQVLKTLEDIKNGRSR